MFLLGPVIGILLVTAILRAWRLTIPLFTVVAIGLTTYFIPPLGWSIIGFVGIITFFVLRSQAKDRRIGESHAGR
jgi:hypothetical protein